MYQEIITYLIIGSAVTLAVIKIVKRFRKKKPKKVDFQNAKITTEHNCTECAAECVLRDMPKRVIETKLDECNTNYHSNKSN